MSKTLLEVVATVIFSSVSLVLATVAPWENVSESETWWKTFDLKGTILNSF